MDAVTQQKPNSTPEAAAAKPKADAQAPTREKIRQAFESGEYPYRTKLSRSVYERQ